MRDFLIWRFVSQEEGDTVLEKYDSLVILLFCFWVSSVWSCYETSDWFIIISVTFPSFYRLHARLTTMLQAWGYSEAACITKPKDVVVLTSVIVNSRVCSPRTSTEVTLSLSCLAVKMLGSVYHLYILVRNWPKWLSKSLLCLRQSS